MLFQGQVPVPKSLLLHKMQSLGELGGRAHGASLHCLYNFLLISIYNISK